jgi:hypothetical protein
MFSLQFPADAENFPCSTKNIPCYVAQGNASPTLCFWGKITCQLGLGGIDFLHFPVLFPVSRENPQGDGFAFDCVISQAVRSQR